MNNRADVFSHRRVAAGAEDEYTMRDIVPAFLRAYEERRDDVGVELFHESEQSLAAKAVKPSWPGCGVTVLLAFDPAPQSRPVFKRDFVGVIVGAKPARAMREGVDDFDCQLRLDFVKSLVERRRDPLMRRAVRDGQDENSGRCHA